MITASKHQAVLFTVFLSILSLTIGYGIVRRISEIYFFDKFYYQKSIDFGYFYFPPNKERSLKIFGKRSQDVLTLLNNKSPDIKGYTSDDNYTVAIVGDSYVWGAGLKNRDRFPILLERKLSTLRGTKVYSFGIGGDGILDYYVKYQKIKELYDIDLYVYVLTVNDMLINKDSLFFNDPIAKTILSLCKERYGDFVYDYNMSKYPDGEDYGSLTKRTIGSFSNNCVFNEVIKQLNPANSFFFFSDEYLEYNTNAFSYYRSLLRQAGFYTLSSLRAKNMEKFRVALENPDKYLLVSKREAHPSLYANEIFAELLAEEITSNAKWGFR